MLPASSSFSGNQGNSSSSNNKLIISFFIYIYILLGLETRIDLKDKGQLLIIGLYSKSWATGL